MYEMSGNFIARNCVNRVRSANLNPAHGRNVVFASGQHQTAIKLPEQDFLRLATVNVGTITLKAVMPLFTLASKVTP